MNLKSHSRSDPNPTPHESEAAAEGSVEAIREAIEQSILSGENQPGERLNELAVARQYDVSRGVVREAVRMLEQIGLVTVVRNHGVFVRKLALEEALDLYDVGAGLAHTVGRLVTARITKEELDELRVIFQEMEEARTASNADVYEERHRHFHRRILAFTRNPTLIALHGQIEKQLRLFMRRSVISLARLRLSNSHHHHILNIIEEGDGEKAAQALETDAKYGRERLLDSLVRD
ncbi:MAG: GntR family transcriptional regulator [Rhodospirillales bacterium]|nr:GntR family transcriptional regulator [Rhodospirillales bacterium]